MSCVHYKFSSKLNYDTVTFDGLHISLCDLKRQIMGREKLKAADCDLQITNAQTKEGKCGRRGRRWHRAAPLRPALCDSSPRSVSQPGAHPAGLRGSERANGGGDRARREAVTRAGRDRYQRDVLRARQSRSFVVVVLTTAFMWVFVDAELGVEQCVVNVRHTVLRKVCVS